MTKQHLFSKFTNKYSLSKTLRFELKPVGKTIEQIEKKGFISNDERRATEYKEVKKIIDGYHKDFIEKALSYLALEDLQGYSDLYFKSNKDEKDKKAFTAMQTKLRKQVAEAFTKSVNEDIKSRFKNLDKKELIKEDLVHWVAEDKKELIGNFSNFTTYFTGFHTNRKNMYSADEKSTAISYRLIHENLPKFLDNIRAFEKIKEAALDFEKLAKELEPVIQGTPIDEFFSIKYFNSCLTQTDITIYNTLLGGMSEEGKAKIQGLNEITNLYNQQLKGEDKKKRLPKLTILFKQILSDREGASFVPDEIEDDNELLNSIQNVYANDLLEFETDGKCVSIFELVQFLANDLQNADLSKVYLKNDLSLTDISNKIYGDWGIIKNALIEYYDKHLLPTKKTKKALEEKEKWLKSTQSIATIQAALQEYDNEVKNKRDLKNPLLWYFQNLGKGDDIPNILDAVAQKYKAVESLLKSDYPDDKKLSADKQAKQLIKEFMDSIMDCIHFVKPLDAAAAQADKDLNFYALYDAVYKQLNEIIPLYNKLRNYLTKKPYSTEKFKLNFENSSLLKGWDKNKEKTNCSVLFRKDELFYLGVMDKEYNTILDNCEDAKSNDVFEKAIYKLLPGAAKSIPKCSTQMKEVKAHFANSSDNYVLNNKNFNAPLTVSEKVFKLNNYVYDAALKDFVPKEGDADKRNKRFQTGYLKETDDEKGYKEALTIWIDFCKDFLSKYNSTADYDYTFKSSKDYESLDPFYKDIDGNSYKISFKDIDSEYIDQLVDEGKLYLFQIYNKDFSPHSKGTPNLHTIYWKMLFYERNLANVVYKLNGEAEMFYRKKSLKVEDTAVHKANESIRRRTDGKTESLFPYEIVKNKRFTVDKFQFHVPITMNFKAEGNERINNDVLKFLKNNPDVNIIGLDRGERHLIYLTLINQKGEILKQKTLNTVSSRYISNGKTIEHTVDYHAKLDAVEKDRTKSRKEWDTIENIKELKSGYLSQIVHEIASMMVEDNAIVVMEDLNFGFKKGRIKVEKQVYQKFEKALIDKLNYLVFKKNEADSAGGALQAFQLTNKFTAFKDLGKQCGFIFYVSADYTSKIDPATGFVNLLYPKHESKEKSQKYFSCFDKICFNKEKAYFEFHTNYKNFTTRAEGTKEDWIICTNGERLVNFRNPEKNSEWDTKKVNLTEELAELLQSKGIEYESGEDVKGAILDQEESSFYRDLVYLLKLTLQMRNSKTGTEIDYLISPVEKNGVFFDSRSVDEKLPKDADANGAYNTARKGLILLDKINSANDVTKLSFKDMAITNKEWLKFAQNR